MPPDRTAFVAALTGLLERASEAGWRSLELTAGDLHRRVGGYPGRHHRMPACCAVMKSMLQPGDDEVLSPPSGTGASLTIRYRLPRMGVAASLVRVKPRTASLPIQPAPVTQQDSARPDSGTTVVLVSCVKSKGAAPAAAKDLYTSPLFRYMRRYAEHHADAWFILSAEHGLLHPTQVISPYERTLKKMAAIERRRWSEMVCKALVQRLPARTDIIILAGESYRGGIEPFLQEQGHTVDIPMRGLDFGSQLRWLKQATSKWP
ncbi:MAG: hypothetical protein U0Q55_21155 [Vicinamibacterales bacterium]